MERDLFLFGNLKKRLNKNDKRIKEPVSIYDNLVPCLFSLLFLSIQFLWLFVFQAILYHPVLNIIFQFSILFLFIVYFLSIVYNIKNNCNVYYIKLHDNKLNEKIINDFAIKHCINLINNLLLAMLQDKINKRESYVKGIFFDLVDYRHFLIFGKSKKYKKTKKSQNISLFYTNDKNSLIDFFTELYKNKIELSDNNKEGIIESIAFYETNFSSDQNSQNYQWLKDFVFSFEYYAKLNYENNILRKNNGSNKTIKNNSIL